MTTKRGEINCGQYFLLLLLTNLVFVITFCDYSVKSKNLLSSLLPLFFSAGVTLVMYFFSYSVAKKSGKSVLLYINEKSNFLSVISKIIYPVYFVYVGALLLLSYSNLFTDRVNPQATVWFILLLMCACCVYSGIKGLEALSRSGIIVFAALVVTILILIFGNINHISFENLSGKFSNSNFLESGIFYIAIGFLPAVSSVLLHKVRGRRFTSAVCFSALSYLITFLLVILSYSVLSSFVFTQNYPIYSLSETTGFSLIKGADGLLFALLTAVTFIGMSLMTICFNNTASKEHSKTSSVICAVLIFILTLLAIFFDIVSSIIFNKYVLFIMTEITGFLIPLTAFVMMKGERKDA